MTLLHVYFHLRNQQAFQRLLEQDRSTAGAPPPGQSASAGKSWTRKNIASALEVNALDTLGRTVLHLACASTELASLEYIRMLLAHPSVHVNLPDKENHWTALHRALYAGNVEAAIMLLKRTDTDTSVKDVEGYTAFDLYNSTVRSAHPTSSGDGRADLLTWGANRNAALGLGDSNDRVHPDHVVILGKDAPLPPERTLEERFRLVQVRDVAMSKLHTVILTDEPRDNVRLCGFGSGGRLGPFPHTLYTPTPLTLSSSAIVSIALGQDHTLALTSAGEVISWGLNRFAQLGYVVESGHGGSTDECIQTTPRKISHLKKEFIKGISACKTASVCWSDHNLWTWGANGGQLGYSKVASSVQVLPRKASIITQPVRGVAMSETAMVCLFTTGEVVCVWNGGVTKINFPAHAFPSDISTIYRPPQAARTPPVTKVACCDDLFAALSSNGEVFTFSVPTSTDTEGSTPGSHTGGNRGQIKPQRVWALRRQFSNVQDVDIGSDGALIVCTQSGHVFVRSRNLKGGTTSSGTKAFRFQRIAHVQRAVSVCTNSTGAFGALRVDFTPLSISVTGRQFSADMAAVAPYIEDAGLVHQETSIALDEIVGTEDDGEDLSILDDIAEVAKLMGVLSNRQESTVMASKHGADLVVRSGAEFEIPAHRVVLAVRCTPLRDLLSGGLVLGDQSCKISVSFTQGSDASFTLPALNFTGITPLSLLILLHYLYADEVLAIWDRRIGSLFEAQFSGLGSPPTRVKADLIALAHLLSLPHLSSALQSVGKRVVKPLAGSNFQWLFDQAQLACLPRRNVCQDPLAPDVALRLADKTIYTHSTVLRARSAFFAALFDDPEWIVDRKDDAGVIDVEMGHHKWQVMQFVLSFVCFGEEAMFETLDFVGNVDELLEFSFLVISAANELLLTRLVLLCSRIVLKYLNVYNACYLLTDAIHFNATDLVDRIQSYMAANLELLLESRILDDLDLRVVRKLSEHIRAEQAVQLPASRSNKLGLAALDKHKEWLALQDIPVPIVPSQKLWSGKESPRMSPPGSTKKGMGRPLKHSSPTTSPVLGPSVGSQAVHGDEIFAMDGADGVPPLKWNVEQAGGREETHVAAKPGWKRSPVTPRTDLKAIMTEAENGKKQTHTRALDGRSSSLGKLGMNDSTSANARASPGANMSAAVPTGSGQGVGVVRQLGHVSRPQDYLGAPRRVPSDTAMSQRPEPLPVPNPNRTTIVSTRATQATPPNPGPLRSAMGPVIIPVRQAPSASVSAGTSNDLRKPSLGGAWTLPPVQPIAATTVPGSTTMLSFAEIQRMQEIQGTMQAPKDKRSLRDIQEEERAHQQEADFLKWWAAEEARVRLEQEQEHEQERRHQSKDKGGRGKSRKPKAGQAERHVSGAVAQQRESQGHRKQRQKEVAPG